MQGGESRKDNPIFTSGDLMYDGIIIREMPEIGRLRRSGCVFCARAAGVLVRCSGTRIRYRAALEDDQSMSDDYGAKKGAGIQMIDVIAKMYFGAGATDTTTPARTAL
jgi:hypothetical protein